MSFRARAAAKTREKWAGKVLLLLTAAGCARFEAPTDPGFVTSNRNPPVDARRDRAGQVFDAGTGAPTDLASQGAEASGASAAGADGPAADAVADAPADQSDAAEAADGAPAGLVAHWPFDEGAGLLANDVTGRGNQASLHNGVTWQPRVPGNLAAPSGNFAIELDGRDDYLQVDPAKLPRLEAPKSIAFWFHARADAPAVTGSTQRTCLALLDAGQTTGLQIGLDRDRPAAWHWGQNQGFVAAPAVPAPGFHHWAYTFDGTSHRLYVDGRPVAHRTLRPPRAPLTRLLIGTYEAPNEMCAGQLDDLRIYERVLSAADIAALARP